MSWGRRRGRDDYWGGWPRYVPVAERKEKARKQAEKLRKKGDSLSPVVIDGRSIAATFWGKAWCENLERYSDYENRIPRGRAYVRNGSVLDLKIGAARVDALVSGSHLYSVAIEIRPLKAKVWKEVKGACTGRIGSLLELLKGKLSREVMEIVTRKGTGLFPEPVEISFRCSCPDWASMCKHVAAVLYGVGAHLDREPELLFRLRDVDHGELITAPEAQGLAASPEAQGRMIAEEDLAGIFGIEIDEKPTALSPVPKKAKRGGRGSKIGSVKADAAAPKRVSGPKPVETKAAPEPLKRKRGRPRREPTIEVPPIPQRRNHSPVPEFRSETPKPARSRRGRPPKAAVSGVTPNPPKRKPGRPRLTPQTGAEKQTAQSPAEPKRERPKLRPAFLKALREEAAVSPPTRRRGRPPGKRKA